MATHATKATRRVVVRLLGGLGNQLFQYAAGRALADASGRTLVFDHALLARDRQRGYALDRWGVNVPTGRPSPSARGVLRIPGFWRLARHTGGTVLVGDTQCLFDRMRGEPIRADARARDVVLTGYWQQRDYFESIEPDLRRTLVHPRAAALEARVAMLGLGPRSIAVHVRRGDYANASVAAMNPALPTSYHRAAVEALNAARLFEHVVVFTDDIAWTREHLRLDLPWRIGSAAEQSADDDLWLMSRAGALVVANSSFSWWAAWLAEAHGAIVAAPRPWFGPRGRSFADPVPDGWKHVGWSE